MIFFNVPGPKEFLIINGYVYTLRKPRSVGVTTAVTGNRFKGDVKPFAKVNVVLIAENITSPDTLVPYAFESGIKIGVTLSSIIWDAKMIAKKWLNLAREKSGIILNLYKVTLVSDDKEKEMYEKATKIGTPLVIEA